jgi:hypothetical protein
MAQSKATSVAAYVDELPAQREPAAAERVPARRPPAKKATARVRQGAAK